MSDIQNISSMPDGGVVESYCSVASARPVKNVPEGKARVAVMMSGGVDSSATAYLIKKAGYDVVGITGWLIKSGSKCCDMGMIDAARVCEQLDIEHHAVDLRELFKNEVLDQFPRSYARGRTPLPCSLCNTIIKWGALYRYSQKHLNADYVATGHYARIEDGEDGLKLGRAVDRKKDQSYVLWGLKKEQLASTLLPLGDYTKEQIRKIAEQAGLVTAGRPDSQDLCFIPEGQTTQGYLAQFLPEAPGPFIHIESGDAIGEHKGTHNYTIGQRRGIGIAWPEPLYVVAVDPPGKTVYVGPKESLLAGGLEACEMNWLVDVQIDRPFAALAKIRYNSPTVPVTVYPAAEDRCRLVFKTPQSAVTPGQVLGLYEPSDTYLIGGGWIDRAEKNCHN